MRQKLKALEAEVTKDTPRPTQNISATQTKNPLEALQKTFESLPTVAKVAAIAVTMVLGLSILSMILKLVVSVVVVAALGIGGYIAYQLFLADD